MQQAVVKAEKSEEASGKTVLWKHSSKEVFQNVIDMDYYVHGVDRKRDTEICKFMATAVALEKKLEKTQDTKNAPAKGVKAEPQDTKNIVVKTELQDAKASVVTTEPQDTVNVKTHSESNGAVNIKNDPEGEIDFKTELHSAPDDRCNLSFKAMLNGNSTLKSSRANLTTSSSATPSPKSATSNNAEDWGLECAQTSICVYVCVCHVVVCVMPACAVLLSE